MPDPPAVGFVTRYVLENPWPLALGLLIVACAIGYTALVRGHLKRLPAAVLLAAAALAVAVAGLVIVTSGERAKLVTRQFVEAVAAEDVTAAGNLLAADATFAFDSPRNPGHDLTFIKNGLADLTDDFSIESNRITRLDAYSEDDAHGLAHLSCWTEAGYGPVISRWVVRVARQSDGSWKVDRITCVSINNNSASSYR